jgi:hypothetical protein
MNSRGSLVVADEDVENDIREVNVDLEKYCLRFSNRMVRRKATAYRLKRWWLPMALAGPAMMWPQRHVAGPIRRRLTLSGTQQVGCGEVDFAMPFLRKHIGTY